jgi:hypothetical protein
MTSDAWIACHRIAASCPHPVSGQGQSADRATIGTISFSLLGLHLCHRVTESCSFQFIIMTVMSMTQVPQRQSIRTHPTSCHPLPQDAKPFAKRRCELHYILDTATRIYGSLAGNVSNRHWPVGCKPTVSGSTHRILLEHVALDKLEHTLFPSSACHIIVDAGG